MACILHSDHKGQFENNSVRCKKKKKKEETYGPLHFFCKSVCPSEKNMLPTPPLFCGKVNHSVRFQCAEIFTAYDEYLKYSQGVSITLRVLFNWSFNINKDTWG